MKVGKLGVNLNFYAALVFILAFMGQNLMILLLLGFVIVAERDEWLGKQAIQAFVLSIFASTINSIFIILNVFKGIPFVGSLVSTLFSIITSLISFVVLIFVLIALSRVIKGRDADIPLASKFANWAYGIVEKKVYTNISNEE